MLGLSVRVRLLLVCYSLRDEGTVIRIISARRATRNEQAFYPGGVR